MIVDHSYVINLPESTERYSMFLKESKNTSLKIERIDGVDARKYIQYSGQVYSYGLSGGMIQNKTYVSGSLGCTFAHLNAIKLAKKNEYSNILIFEDDVQIIEDFDAFLNSAIAELPSDWAILRLHPSTTSIANKESFSDNLYRVFDGDGLYAVLINSKYYDKIIKIIESEIELFDKYGSLRVLDAIYSINMRNMPVFESKKILAYHRNGFSDRTQHIYNYNRERPVSGETLNTITETSNGKIGIGITTCNRPELIKKCIKAFEKFKPDNCVIFINDDTERREGVALSKNRCIEALQDCEYVFLFDDDILPTSNNWWQKYIDKSLETCNQHFCLTFDKFANGVGSGNQLIKSENGLDYFSHPDGKLLFLTNRAIRIAGGMDCSYSKYGSEHAGYSTRIYNLGLTKHPFISVSNSLEDFHCLDYHWEHKTCISEEEKRACALKSEVALSFDKVEKYWKPYYYGDYALTIFMVGAKYNYGNFKGISDISLIRNWAESLKKVGVITGIVFHNCFTEEQIDSFKYYPVRFVFEELPAQQMTGMYRFKLYNKFLKRFQQYIRNAYFCDSTDLEFLKNPANESNFDISKIYLGTEPCIRNQHGWMMNMSKRVPEYANLLNNDKSFSDSVLINAGFQGGSYNKIAPFIEKVSEYCMKIDDPDVEDMAIVNIVAWKPEFKKDISTGSHVNTVFTKNEVDNKTAYIRHK